MPVDSITKPNSRWTAASVESILWSITVAGKTVYSKLHTCSRIYEGPLPCSVGCGIYLGKEEADDNRSLLSINPSKCGRADFLTPNLKRNDYSRNYENDRPRDARCQQIGQGVERRKEMTTGGESAEGEVW